MSSTIKPGDLVICVNAAAPHPTCARQLAVVGRIKQGAVYRVSGTLWLHGEPGLQLKGIDHSPTEGWRAARFRKVEPADSWFTASIRKILVEDLVS
jgi:hypothetical protein